MLQDSDCPKRVTFKSVHIDSGIKVWVWGPMGGQGTVEPHLYGLTAKYSLGGP